MSTDLKQRGYRGHQTPGKKRSVVDLGVTPCTVIEKTYGSVLETCQNASAYIRGRLADTLGRTGTDMTESSQYVLPASPEPGGMFNESSAVERFIGGGSSPSL